MRVSDRKNLDWNALKDEFYNMVCDTTPETAVRMELSIDESKGEADGINVYPAETNRLNVFYFPEELVDFCRCKGLDCYVDIDEGFVRVHIH